MQSNPLRFILALVVGVFVAYCVTVFLQSYMPKLLNYGDLAENSNVFEFQKYLENLPTKAIVAIIACTALGSFSGGYAAARITKTKKKEASLAVGIFSTVIAMFMIIAFSYPLVLAVGVVLALVPFAYIGGRLAIVR